jgi:flagellar basal-body rod protein FlgF
MSVTIDVAISAQLALQKRLDTIADNVANTNTAGFRAEQIKFDSIVSRFTDNPVHFANHGESYLSAKTGAFIQSDNPLDLAIKGDAWLAIQTPAGLAYTKDGRMQIIPTGELQTLNGYSVLDPGGAPLLLNPNAGPPSIAQNGDIRQAGRRIGAIGLYEFPDNVRLDRLDNSSVVAGQPAEPILEGSRASVHQGFVERSNVNGVGEITDLITVSRAFEAVTEMIKKVNDARRDAIRDIGGV